MALYEYSSAIAGGGAVSVVTPFWDVMSQATNRAALVEFCVGHSVALQNNWTYQLGRSANTPVQMGATNPAALDPSDRPSVSTMAVAWSTAPTAPTAMLRRCLVPLGAGAGVIWSFPRGLAIAASTSLCVFASPGGNANLAGNFYATVNE